MSDDIVTRLMQHIAKPLDIVDELRNAQAMYDDIARWTPDHIDEWNGLEGRAADEIEHLRAQIELLKGTENFEPCSRVDPCEMCKEMIQKGEA